MQIIRLETDEGLGVFCGRVMNESLNEAEFKHAMEHPGPYDDYGLRKHFMGPSYPPFGVNRRFAFANTRQMLDWFPRKALRKLRKNGIQISRYEVPDAFVIKGDEQVVFDRSKARSV